MFRIDPQRFFAEEQWGYAHDALRRFEHSGAGTTLTELTANAARNRITAADIVAVKLLGAEVPAGAATWMLGGGVVPIEQCLAAIPPAVSLWDDDDHTRSGGPLDSLGALLLGRPGMDRESTSKLLAVKRPHLVPVYEPAAAAMLFDDPEHVDDVSAWRTRLRGPDGDELRERIAVINESGLPVLFAAYVVITASVARQRNAASVTSRAGL